MRRARIDRDRGNWCPAWLAQAPGLVIAGIFIGLSGVVSVTSWYEVGQVSGNGLIMAAAAIGAEASADLAFPLWWPRVRLLGKLLVVTLFAACLGYKLEAAKHFSSEKLGARDAAMAKSAENYELARERVEALRKIIADNADARAASVIEADIATELRDPKAEGCPAGVQWNGPVTSKVCPKVDKLRGELARAKERDKAQGQMADAIADWRKASPTVVTAAQQSPGPVALLLALLGISVASWSALMSTLFMMVVEAGAIIVPMLNGLARRDERKPAPAGEASGPATGQATADPCPATGESPGPQSLPQGVTERTRRDIAELTGFLGSNSERAPGERVQASKLYALYLQQKTERGEQAMTVAQFGTVLTKHLGLAKIKSGGSNWYIGLRLRHPAQGRMGAKHLQAVAA
jgi:hypothetical protein